MLAVAVLVPGRVSQCCKCSFTIHAFSATVIPTVICLSFFHRPEINECIGIDPTRSGCLYIQPFTISADGREKYMQMGHP